MHQIISFFVKHKIRLLFIVLQFIALSLTVQSHSFHRSKYINSANIITGFVYEKFNILNNKTNLKLTNKQLVIENNKLKNLLVNKNNDIVKRISILDSLVYNQKFTYVDAIITNNVYKKSNNVLTLNKGTINGVNKDQGVINNKGVVGITANVSAHYATVNSILNESTKINARLKNSAHFGSIVWNGKDYKTVQFEDIPRQANLKIGDTVITDGKSTIFPEGILVGKIKNFKKNNKNFVNVGVTLFNDMSALRHVNIVTNLDKLELINLTKSNE